MKRSENNFPDEETGVNRSAGRRKYFWFFLLMFFIISGFIFAAYKWVSHRQIKNITVSGNSIVSADEIKEKVGSPVINSPNAKVKLDKIQKQVEVIPYVNKTNVIRKSAEEISIEVVERIPEAIITLDDGTLGFIDIEGNYMPYRVKSDLPDIPVIRNIVLDNQIDSSALKCSLTIIKELKKDENLILYKNISEIIYNRTDGTFNLTAADGGFKILIGKMDRLAEKLGSLREFWRNSITQCNLKKIKYLDARWSQQIVINESKDS